MNRRRVWRGRKIDDTLKVRWRGRYDEGCDVCWDVVHDRIDQGDMRVWTGYVWVKGCMREVRREETKRKGSCKMMVRRREAEGEKEDFDAIRFQFEIKTGGSVVCFT